LHLDSLLFACVPEHEFLVGCGEVLAGLQIQGAYTADGQNGLIPEFV
jgi:hypothetical protein